MKSSFQEKDNYPKECFNKKIEKAIEIAHGIRKFETELFWSRTKFFYTMFAATAGGYFYIYNNINSQNNKISLKILLITSCVGLISSIAWYLVNRGSKYWMENWETHIDNLEDEVTGPLLKTTTSQNSYNKLNLLQSYPFSPTKITLILNLIAIVFWIFIIWDLFYNFILYPHSYSGTQNCCKNQSNFACYCCYENTCCVPLFYVIVLLLTILSIFFLLYLSPTNRSGKDLKFQIHKIQESASE